MFLLSCAGMVPQRQAISLSLGGVSSGDKADIHLHLDQFRPGMDAFAEPIMHGTMDNGKTEVAIRLIHGDVSKSSQEAVVKEIVCMEKIRSYFVARCHGFKIGAAYVAMFIEHSESSLADMLGRNKDFQWYNRYISDASPCISHIFTKLSDSRTFSLAYIALSSLFAHLRAIYVFCTFIKL